MLVTEIITEARTLSYSTSEQFSNTQCLTRLNFLYQELCGEVKLLNENYFYTEGYMDTVPYQNTYSFTLATSTANAVQKILMMTVKYQNDTYDARVTGLTYTQNTKVTNGGYTYICKVDHTAGATFAGDLATKRQIIYENYVEARETNFSTGDLNGYNASNVNAFIDKYGRSADVGNPVYVLTSANSNIMSTNIYPFIQYTVKSGIKYNAIKSIIDLTISDTEDLILIERNYHKVLVLGLIPYIYQAKGMFQERQVAENNYNIAKRKMKAEISDRTFSATEVILPNMTYME